MIRNAGGRGTGVTLAKVFPSFDEALSLFEDCNISDPMPVGFVDVVSQYLGGAPTWNVCPQI